MQFGLEQRKVELLEQESRIKVEKLKAEAACDHLHVAKEKLQLAQLLKEGVSQDEIISTLPCLNMQMLVKQSNHIITVYIWLSLV